MSLVAGSKLAELLVVRDKDSALPASFPYVTLSDDPEDPTRLHAIRLQSTLPLTVWTTWSLTDPTQGTVSPPQ